MKFELPPTGREPTAVGTNAASDRRRLGACRYPEYQNERDKYVSGFVNHLIN